MFGVPRELIKHELHLDPKAKLVKHQLCHFAQDKKDVIKKEIAPVRPHTFKRLILLVKAATWESSRGVRSSLHDP
jgi:hypothetical protein